MGPKRVLRERGQKAGDFWRAWRKEQRRVWRELKHEGWMREAMPPAEVARAWRDYFHTYMGSWPEAHWLFGGRRFSPWHQGLDTFNPFVATLLSKGGGLLALLVLELLAAAPRYGNELMELIAEKTRGGWVANPGAIYPLMNQLEVRGLVEGVWQDPLKRTIRQYSLTAEGRREVNRMKAIVRPKLDEAVEVLRTLCAGLGGAEVPAGAAGGGNA
jgi:DNA-binding PadR family transcriptional regulator